MSDFYRLKFEQSFKKGRYSKLEKRIAERLITKEYVIQLGDVFFEENVPVFLAIIIEEAPPKSWNNLEKNKVILNRMPIVNRGPEQEKITHFVLNALEGTAFVKRDQVCYIVLTKRYAKEDAIEIQIGKYKNGKN